VVPHREIHLANGALSASAAREGHLDMQGGGTALEDEVYDMVTDMRGIGAATNDALRTHIDELQTQQALTQVNGQR
jgi:hypothetical protein